MAARFTGSITVDPAGMAVLGVGAAGNVRDGSRCRLAAITPCAAISARIKRQQLTSSSAGLEEHMLKPIATTLLVLAMTPPLFAQDAWDIVRDRRVEEIKLVPQRLKSPASLAAVASITSPQNSPAGNIDLA